MSEFIETIHGWKWVHNALLGQTNHSKSWEKCVTYLLRKTRGIKNNRNAPLPTVNILNIYTANATIIDTIFLKINMLEYIF